MAASRPMKAERLPGGTELNEAGDGPELVVVLVGLHRSRSL